MSKVGRRVADAVMDDVTLSSVDVCESDDVGVPVTEADSVSLDDSDAELDNDTSDVSACVPAPAAGGSPALDVATVILDVRVDVLDWELVAKRDTEFEGVDAAVLTRVPVADGVDELVAVEAPVLVDV